MVVVVRWGAAEFSRCVDVLSRKLDDLAAKAGVPDGECSDLESTLSARPLFARDRAAVMLQGIQVQADEEFPAMAFAASYVVELARTVWDEQAHSPMPRLSSSRHQTERA